MLQSVRSRLVLMESRSVEYVALVGSFLLVGLEAIIRVLTLALRMAKCASPRGVQS